MRVEQLDVVGDGTPAFIVWDVLSEHDFKQLEHNGRFARFRPIPKENGTNLYCCEISPRYDFLLSQAMAEAVGKQLRNIVSFYRLNTSKLDTEFRVHCDSVIQGEMTDWACVFYLNDSASSGTAFYEHPVYGRHDESKLAIFNEDDGRWTPYYRYYAARNSMLVYPAKVFHGRFPWRATGDNKRDGRIVVAKFMKEA
jgi:hypothetical protein